MVKNKSTALLVVDMLYDFAHKDGKVFYEQNLDILPNILDVLSCARKAHLTVIFAAHYHRQYVFDRELTSGRRQNCIEGSGGEQLLEELNFDKTREFLVKKRRYNAFVGTDLDLILREHNIGNLIIVGTKTNCCIRATVEGAYHLEYYPIVIKECVATNDMTVNQVHLQDIDKYLGTVIELKDFYRMVENGDIHE